jgi:hypothetical protein
VQRTTDPWRERSIVHIDVYPVHTASVLRAWLHSEYKGILMLVYVPANCTSVMQVADVSLNRPFKAKYTSEFNRCQIQGFLESPSDDTGASLSQNVAAYAAP